MSNPETPEAPKAPESPSHRNGSNPADAPKATGFGEFAEVYRARWVANHPVVIKRWQNDLAPGTHSPPAPDAEDTSSPIEQRPPTPPASETQ
jgi:hypothetical protein